MNLTMNAWQRLDAFSTFRVPDGAGIDWPCRVPQCRKSATVWISTAWCDQHGGAHLASKLDAAVREREEQALAESGSSV